MYDLDGTWCARPASVASATRRPPPRRAVTEQGKVTPAERNPTRAIRSPTPDGRSPRCPHLLIDGLVVFELKAIDDERGVIREAYAEPAS